VSRPNRTQTRRPLLLWVSALWLLALGAIDLWRGTTLWQTRRLLAELGSTLSLFASALLVLGWLICGAALLVSSIGLWLRREWSRHTARAAIVAHLCLIQAYTWAFVRTGLLWERRWSTLLLGVLATAVGLTALTWPRSRRWLGLQRSNEPSTTT
jgi:hypothetical protein